MERIITTGIFLLTLFALGPRHAYAQQASPSDIVPQIYPGSIPSAPVFSLLGVNPEIVTRPSDVKEFKVDWRIKNYKVAPDLALEGQPLWWLYYRRKGLKAYQQSSGLERVLATTSLSFATAKIDGLNHMGMAVKVNLYKEYDPYLDKELQKKYLSREDDLLQPLRAELDSLLIQLRDTEDKKTKKEIAELVRDKESEIQRSRKHLVDEFENLGTEHVQEKWNMDMLDLAFGLVNKYDNAALDSLKIRYAGFGIWLNGAKGIGKNGLLTGIIRLNQISENTDFLMGVSFRYGSDKFNFFSEVVTHRIGNNRANGFHEDEVYGYNLDQDIGTGWYEYAKGPKQTMYTLAFGGDFRLRKNILLNFALRTQMRKGIGFDNFVPIANVVCLMH